MYIILKCILLDFNSTVNPHFYDQQTTYILFRYIFPRMTEFDTYLKYFKTECISAIHACIHTSNSKEYWIIRSVTFLEKSFSEPFFSRNWYMCNVSQTVYPEGSNWIWCQSNEHTRTSHQTKRFFVFHISFSNWINVGLGVSNCGFQDHNDNDDRENLFCVLICMVCLWVARFAFYI